MSPRATFIIGAYDSAATLERAMVSVLAQTVTDLELIVVDDGSTDGSRTVAERLARYERRVRVLAMKRNVGIARSLNAAIAEARAPVVAIQDADDWSEPHRLERQLEALADPQVAVVGSRMKEVGPDGCSLTPRTTFASGVVNDLLMRFNPIPNTSAAMRRDAVLALGGYDPRYRYAAEYDLWLRLAEHHVVLALDEPLSTRSMSGVNVAARAERAQTQEALLIRIRTLRRRRTLRGASGLLLPSLALATPAMLKRTRRRRLGQAP